METRQWQGIFLDFYGTLAAGDRQAVESICQAIIDDYQLEHRCADLALQWGLRYFEAIEGDHSVGFRTLRQIEHDTLVATCGQCIPGFRAERYIDRFNAYLANPPLFPEVKEVLGQLALPVCIVSNADEHELLQAMAAHGLEVEHCVSSERARSYKPHPRIFQHALEKTGWKATRVLHVGDSLHSDVGGAQPLGISTAWVCRQHRINDIGTARPDYVWEDLRPLLQL